MEKTKKDSPNYLRGTISLIARKCGCSTKYVSLVLNGKLGKYEDRDTELVRKIRETATVLDELFSPQE